MFREIEHHSSQVYEIFVIDFYSNFCDIVDSVTFSACFVCFASVAKLLCNFFRLWLSSICLSASY